MPSNPYNWHLEDDIFWYKVTDFVTKYREYDHSCHNTREYLTIHRDNDMAQTLHVYNHPDRPDRWASEQ